MVGEDNSYPVQVGELRVCSDAPKRYARRGF